MGRSPHLRSGNRSVDFSGNVDVDLDFLVQTKFGNKEETISMSGGFGYLREDRHDGLVGYVVVHGDVPEIPDIEHIHDTGWEFKQRTYVSPSSWMLSFYVPYGSEKYLERLLGFYILLYGDI